MNCLPASIISPKFAEIIWYCHPPRLQTRDTSRANKHPQLCIIRPLSSSSTQVWVEQLAADPRSQEIKTWETWGGSFARSSGRRWQEVAASSSAVSLLRHAVISPVLQSSDTQEGYTQEKKWRDSPPPRTMCRVAVLCSRQQPPTINLGDSIYQLLTLWMLKLAACPDKTNFARTEQSEMKWKVELIAKVLGWYQTRDVTLLYEALNIPHAKNNWVQFRLCHLSRIEIHIVLFPVKIA